MRRILLSTFFFSEFLHYGDKTFWEILEIFAKLLEPQKSKKKKTLIFMLSYRNFFLKSNTFSCDLHWILDLSFERDEACLAYKINKTKIWIPRNWFYTSPRKLILCVLFFPHLRQGIHLMGFSFKHQRLWDPNGIPPHHQQLVLCKDTNKACDMWWWHYPHVVHYIGL